MGMYLSDRELNERESAQEGFASAVPTQIVSNGEFNPIPQTPNQKKVEERMKELADVHGAKQGLDRRTFLQTSCGMAAAFLAMNEVYGEVFQVSEAEAADREMMAERSEPRNRTLKPPPLRRVSLRVLMTSRMALRI